MRRLVLIDGNAIMHRAYHALPNFTTSKNDPVGAIFGFVSMLLKIIQDLKPTHMVVAFDKEAPTFRQELYVEYQAHRPKMEGDLVSQVEGIHKVVEAFGIPIFELDGYEADDVIGTLATQAVARGPAAPSSHPTSSKKSSAAPTGFLWALDGTPSGRVTPRSEHEVIIVTGDRDMLQLVNDHVKVYAPIKGLSEAKMYGSKEVAEKYGVNSHQVVDLKALMGDASDNYPGVRGIGPKTASLLIQKYETLENLYKHLGELPEKQMKALSEEVEHAALAKKLATIVTDAPVHLDWEECKFEIKDKQKVVETLRGFEFRTLTNRFLELMGEKPLEAQSTLKKSEKQAKEKDTNQLELI